MKYGFICNVSLFLCTFSGAYSQTSSDWITGDVVPGATWQQVQPESVGYSSKQLEVLRAWLKTQETTSMLVVVQGRVIFSYGDVSDTSKIASARKRALLH